MAKIIYVIDVRDMHTAIHNLFPILHKPLTVLKAFKELNQGINEEDNWNFINANCGYSFEINYRFIDASDNYTENDQKYHIINNHAIDIWGM